MYVKTVIFKSLRFIYVKIIKKKHLFTLILFNSVDLIHDTCDNKTVRN